MAPTEGWAPSGQTPRFHDLVEAPAPLPTYPETPAGLVEALAAWRSALPFFERFKLRRARSEAQVRSALAFFDDGRGPPPLLVAWFHWWDGQTDSGSFRRGEVMRAYSLAEALVERDNLMGLGAPWSDLKGWTRWLPLFDHCGDVTLFFVSQGQAGLWWIDHETPGALTRSAADEGPGDALTEVIAEAAATWRAPR